MVGEDLKLDNFTIARRLITPYRNQIRVLLSQFKGGIEVAAQREQQVAGGQETQELIKFVFRDGHGRLLTPVSPFRASFSSLACSISSGYILNNVKSQIGLN